MAVSRKRDHSGERGCLTRSFGKPDLVRQLPDCGTGRQVKKLFVTTECVPRGA
jgi:hypothetical protein